MLHSFLLNHLINHLTFWFLLSCHIQPLEQDHPRKQAAIIVGDIRGWGTHHCHILYVHCRGGPRSSACTRSNSAAF